MNVFVNKKNLIIFLLIICGISVGYFALKEIKNKKEKQFFVLARVERGIISSLISASGQVSPKDQIEIKSRVAGEIEKIFVEKDQIVKKGDLLLKLKTKDFEKAIEEAELNLKSEITKLENIELDFKSEKSKLENLEKTKDSTQESLKDTLKESFLLISDIFGKLPSTINNLEKIFAESTFDAPESDIDYYWQLVCFYKNFSFIKNEKENKFFETKKEYNQKREKFIFLTSNSSEEELKIWLKETLNLIEKISDLSKEGKNIILLYKDLISEKNLTPPISISITENQLSALESIISFLDKSLSNLLVLSQKIDQLENSLSNLKDQILIQKEAIQKIEEQINLQKEIIKQKEKNLEKARENYENCFIKSNFNGKVAKINLKEGELISQNTSLLLLITTEKIIELSLNEIDAAKVKIGQEAILKFDSFPDLTLTGKVIEIDPVGTVSQGVVNYGVKISLDSDDERIKPSMSVEAQIIEKIKSDVLVIPSRALRTKGELKYVELIEGPPEIKNRLKIGSQITLPKEIEIKNQNVEIGISNENQTEIISGLKEGDIVIVSKIPQQGKPNQNYQSQFRFPIPGLGVPPK